MTEWFQTAFGEDYLSLYAHRDASEAAMAVDLILDYTKLPTGSLLIDAPCGAGRHLAVFRERQMHAVGFDLSLPLLREAVQTPGVSGNIVRADIRALPFASTQCDMVVNLFSSLGYFATDAVNMAVIANLASLVRSDGWLVIDFMHSEYVSENLQAESHRTTASGIVVHDTRWIDGTPPRVNKRTGLTYPDGQTQTLEESVRLFSPRELRDALAANGMTVEAEFGSYNGEPFSRQSARIILMGRKH